MEKLPTEIFHQIFSLLNVLDQVSVSLVCRRFHTIIMESDDLPRFLEIDTNMYATNTYCGRLDLMSLLDKACSMFSIKAVRISNQLHKITVSQAALEDEVSFNFTECPDSEKQEMFTDKYDDDKDVVNLEKLIHTRGIAKAYVGNQKEAFQDMFDYVKETNRDDLWKGLKTQCRVCMTGEMSGKGLVQHLKSKSHNLLTNIKHRDCSYCVENLWSAGFLTVDDLKRSRMFRDLQGMIKAKNKDIFGRNYHLTRSDGFLENLLLGLLVQTNLNDTIESLRIDVKMIDMAMIEVFDTLRSFINLKKLSLVDFGSDWSMGFMFYEFMKDQSLVCITTTEGDHEVMFRRFLDEEGQIGLDQQGFPMSSLRRNPDVPEATSFLLSDFRSLHCTHARDGSKDWTKDCHCGVEKFPSWYW